VALSPATWVVDKSVLARVGRAEVRSTFLPRAQAGRVAVTILTELEVGFSARSIRDHESTLRTVLAHLLPAFVTPRAEQRAREVQAALIRRGQHRAVSIPDLLVAAVAEVERLTVLHYDSDFDLIAKITAQPTEWIVPRGSID